jgi:hypothetical protein
VPKFSHRHNFDPRIPKSAVLEEAPEGLRIAYLNSVLEPIVNWNSSHNDERPLHAYELSRQFCSMARMEMPDFGYSNTSTWDDLKYLIKGAEWFNFYDFVEYVAKSLVKTPDGTITRFVEQADFEKYKQQVNDLFLEDRIGWRLNDSGELVREIPSALARRLEETSNRLSGEFTPARRHYLKAVRYVSGRPLDPENAIKEIISAVESVGRVFYPNANTLGDVAKEMRKKAHLMPPVMVQMIEKFYGYASSEPAVRHGSPVQSRVFLADAEFCLHVGVALIRYMLERHDSAKKNPTAENVW